MSLAAPTAADGKSDPGRHGPLEDAFAFLIGAMLVAVGLEFFRLAGMATGGTAGVAMLFSYATGLPLGLLFFAVNLPFYVFAYRALGRVFTLKTFAAVSLLSALTFALPKVLAVARLDPIFAAIAGGIFVGMGLLALIRHKASLGGIGVLAYYLQEKKGWRAGKVQMAADCAIVAAALFVLPIGQVALSVLGAVVMNLVLAVNHKPGRYNGF